MKPPEWRSMMSCADYSWKLPEGEASANATADGWLRRASRTTMLLGSRRRLGKLSAQAYESQHHLVSLASELRDGTISGLLQRSVDDGLFELRGKFRIPEILPPAGHGASNVFHEVAN